MIEIKDLISTLKQKDQRAFIAYLNQRNKRKDVRNIALFTALLKDKEGLIKNEIGGNAYNALKKRLSDQLIEFIASTTLSKELSDEDQVIKLIIVARKLFIENKIDLAYTLLLRAEKKAIQLNRYSMLNEIYHSMIEYSHKNSADWNQALFLKMEKNNHAFIEQERLITLYSSMQHLFTSKSFKNLPSTLHQLYEENCIRFGINKKLTFNFKSIHQLCILADLYGSQTKNYHLVDLFFEDTIKELQSSEQDTDLMLSYHLEVLYAMANIYFRKKDLSRSKYYLDQLYIQMERDNRRFFSIWYARYINLIILNLNFTSKAEKALEISLVAMEDSSLKETERALLSLTRMMIFFQQGQLDEVKNCIQSLNRSDAWYLKHMGNEWLFNFKSIEILLHYDLENDLLVDSLIQRFHRKYGIHFKKDKANPIWPFLQLIKLISADPSHLHSAEFAAKVENNIPWRGEQEDLFNMCFFAWLKAKMDSQPVYETTLDILGFS